MKANIKYKQDMVQLILKLWPHHSVDEMEKEVNEYLCSKEKGIFIKVIEGKCVGMALCCLRHDYIEGCNSSPVGYLEGIVVDDDYRMNGIAGELCKECEKWAKESGCTEFASDCELNNEESLRFHLNIGFKEENRIICFKKMIE